MRFLLTQQGTEKAFLNVKETVIYSGKKVRLRAALLKEELPLNIRSSQIAKYMNLVNGHKF